MVALILSSIDFISFLRLPWTLQQQCVSCVCVLSLDP